MITNWLKKHKFFSFIIVAYVVTGFYRLDILQKACSNTIVYLIEMVEVLPAVFILTGLINAWVSSSMIIKHFGYGSGLKGKMMSFAIGSLSAGPIYAAFPLAQSLLNKGASVGNVIIIISSWAVIKIPMLIVEVRFLGLPFALSRYLLTIPGIVLLSVVCEKVIGKEKIHNSSKDEIKDITQIEQLEAILPGLNCGSCGYSSCMEYAIAVYERKATVKQCKPGGEEVLVKLQSLFQ